VPAPPAAAGRVPQLARRLPAARGQQKQPASLFAPAVVSDRTDGKIVHLDGLNLSRAWCWREIAARCRRAIRRGPRREDAADRHLAASLPHVAGDYMGEHWLASFALLALTSSAGLVALPVAVRRDHLALVVGFLPLARPSSSLAMPLSFQ
jgi:hypothetical protein